MKTKNILLIGGSGFLGGHVARRLAAQGHRLTVPTRHRERARHLLVLPTVEVVETDVHDDARLAERVAGQDAVINMVGILHSRYGLPYGPDFARAHVELPRRIAAACRAAGVRRVVHVSALNADVNGPSQYLRSKGEGEAAVMAAAKDLDVTVLCPSVIFGTGDKFLNTFATILKLAPVFAAGGLTAKFQPVYVGNVADAFVGCIEDIKTFGQRYELVGPKVYTLRELVDYTAQLVGRLVTDRGKG